MAKAKRRKGTWGGARPGSGRKPTLEDAVLLNLKMARADVERLRAVAQAKSMDLSSYVRGVLLRSLAAHERRR